MELPAWLDADLWVEFRSARKKMKSPMTEYAEKLLIGKLEKLKAQGYNVREIVEESIMRGWSGLFPPRDKPPCAAPLQAKPAPVTLRDFERAAKDSPIALQALADMKRMLGAKAGH